MNFSGYVPLRRGILEHTMDSSLTLQEFAAFTVLLMNADKSTGSGKVNGPVLRSYLPGLSTDAAKRVLHSLEEKRYIFRQITPRSPLVYPYWINNYRPTTGPHKMLQLSIEQALTTQDPRDIRYIVPAPEGALDTYPESAPDSAPEGAHYNKKEKEKDKKPENPSCPSESDFRVSEIVSANETNNVSQLCAAREFQVSEKVSEKVSTCDDDWQLPPGYELRDGYAGAGVYGPDGLKRSPTAVASLKRNG